MRYREIYPNSRLPEIWKSLNLLTGVLFVLMVISLF
jgi:hypothetical protein